MDALPWVRSRSMCPGATMADHVIFVFAATILWALDIRPALNEAGEEVLPAVDPMQFSSGGEASYVQFTTGSARVDRGISGTHCHSVAASAYAQMSTAFWKTCRCPVQISPCDLGRDAVVRMWRQTTIRHASVLLGGVLRSANLLYRGFNFECKIRPQANDCIQFWLYDSCLLNIENV